MPSRDWNKRWAEELAEPRRGGDDEYYGQRWGDPRVPTWRNRLARLLGRPPVGPGDLYQVARRFVHPHVDPQHVVLEIGPGGGRWTELLLPFKEIVLVDLNPEFFPYLKQRFPDAVDRMQFYQTTGYELGGIASGSVDFVFSFGTFVHIDADGVAQYLTEISRVLKPGGAASLQYADQDKPRAQAITGFADMDAPRMETLVVAAGFKVSQHDTELLNHSNVIELRKS